MKKAGLILALIGIVSGIFIYYYDLIVKGEQRVTLGPRSGPLLGLAVLAAVVGVTAMIVSAGSSGKGR